MPSAEAQERSADEAQEGLVQVDDVELARLEQLLDGAVHPGVEVDAGGVAGREEA